jgi:hypothetical protein
MTAAAPAPTAPATVPGKTLGIIAIILTVPLGLSILGIILGFVARAQSKAAGFKNTPATVAIVIGFIVFIGTILFFALGGVALFSGIVAACADYGPGVHELADGTTLTCS